MQPLKTRRAEMCTTELGMTAKLQTEWSTRGVKVIGLSVDSTDDHERWVIADINETQGTLVNFPIIADKDRRVSFDALLDARSDQRPTGSGWGRLMTVRSVFIIPSGQRSGLS